MLAQIALLQTNRGEEETRRLQPEIAGVREEPAEVLGVGARERVEGECCTVEARLESGGVDGFQIRNRAVDARVKLGEGRRARGGCRSPRGAA